MKHSLCKYSDIFGKLRTGAHSYRLFDIAVVDVAATILVGSIIGYFINVTESKIKDISLSIFILFILGIIAHRLFCVRTTIDTLLF